MKERSVRAGLGERAVHNGNNQGRNVMRTRKESIRSGTAAIIVAMAMLFCVSSVTAQWENRGDLNLNGLPFELVDLAIFADYWAIGLPAFTIDLEPQIAATDINMDGLVLTVADYVMMIRIEMGAGDPPPADPDTFVVSFTYNYTDSSLIVSARFDEIPAAMYMDFDFDTYPTFTARLLYTDGAISMGTAGYGWAASLLVTGMNNLPPGGGYQPLVEMVYQDDKPTTIRAAVQGAAGGVGRVELDTTFIVGDVNDDGNINVGDAVYMVNWIFRSGPLPPHLEAADVNCDLARNVGDAVYIVNYVFRSGPGPVLCGPPSGELTAHSDCLTMEKGDGDGQAASADDCIEYQYDGRGTLLLRHANAGLNCCPGQFPATVTIADGMITIDESPIPGNCPCLCLFDLDFIVTNLQPGTYQLFIIEQCVQPEDHPLVTTINLVSAPSGSFCVPRGYYPWQDMRDGH
ncbi:MAG: hypothetical protein GYA46_13380 [candidate division Zixibacteria bacterium]|nr:hypothetical protein [candidate division Zixibacteria bacterium]